MNWLHAPEAREWYPLRNGDRAVVEVFACGAIGCAWHYKGGAKPDTPVVNVRPDNDGYAITFTNKVNDTFCIDVEQDNALWAEACANFVARAAV